MRYAKCLLCLCSFVAAALHAPDNQDIFFVSADKDYCSVLSKNKFNSFLLNEWHERKNSELHFYTCLTEFFDENLPQIEFSSEKEKNDIIASLSESSCFKETHKIISQLQEYSNWTPNQVSA